MKAIVIGIGNPHRHDDGLGPAVVEALNPSRPAGAEFVTSTGEMTHLVDQWDGMDLAIVVDTVWGGSGHRSAKPGRVHRLELDWPQAETATAAAVGGPCTDFGEAVEFAAALGRRPDRLVLYAIEAANVDEGVGLSPAISKAVGKVAGAIARELHTALIP
jgi:hydrogenase maturation protease